MDTRNAGFVDAVFLSPTGMPTLVECKLWRNPEARREVVGQILDYARAVRRWTVTELQREAARARREQGFRLADFVKRQSCVEIDEAEFCDNVSRNFAKGRILLIILGDGIREGVEAIAEYMQDTAGMQFTLGLVEAKVFELGTEQRIVQTRILARTLIINRTVVDLANPELSVLDVGDETPSQPQATLNSPPDERRQWMRSFWSDLLSGLKLDDENQPLATPIAGWNVYFRLPTKEMWLSCYFSQRTSNIGVFLSTKKSPLAMEIAERLTADRKTIDEDFVKADVRVRWRDSDQLEFISAFQNFVPLRGPETRDAELAWFSKTINAFVNVLRPRIQALAEELSQDA
jgi:hypothetical protein